MKITLLALLVCLSCPLSADTESDITAALDYFSELWNEGDFEAMRGYYHPDFILITQNGVIPLQQRLADIESVTEEVQDRGELEYTEVTVQEIEEKHAMAYGHSNLRFKDGSSIDNWFVTVYVKTPFGWKAILTRN